MNIEQESYLSAYLDGELDSEPQSRVESALIADPGLSERLRELSTVRDLVGGLSRPLAPIDVSAAVLARLEPRRSSGIGQWIAFVSGTKTARVATLVAAASVLVACTLIGLDKIGRVPSDHQAIVDRPEILGDLPKIATNPPEPPSPFPSNVVERNVSLDPAPIARSFPPSRVEGEGEGEGDAAAARKLLEHPQLDRVFMLTDVLGGDVDRQVVEILKTTARQSSRTTFGRIVVQEGIVIGPQKHPGQTVVFAVVMNDVELREFQERLANKYSGPIHVSALGPDLISRLSEAGTVSLIAGRAGSGLKAQPTLREEEASRALKGGTKAAEKILVRDSDPVPTGSDPFQDPDFRAKGHESALVVVDRDAPTPGQLQSAPHPSVRMAKDAPEAKSAEPGSSSTFALKTTVASEMVGPARLRESLILVWVTTSVETSPTPR